MKSIFIWPAPPPEAGGQGVSAGERLMDSCLCPDCRDCAQYDGVGDREKPLFQSIQSVISPSIPQDFIRILAGAVIFLALDALYVTGHALDLDGGRSRWLV